MSLQHYSSPSPPLEYSSPVPYTSTVHDGYFGETGVYYDPEGITEVVDIGNTATPTSRPKKLAPPATNPALRLLWLLVSSMVAVQEGNCQYCPTHNGLYPNVGNCKCYFKCIDGVPVQKSCPPGKKFDVMSMSCTFHTNTVCAGSLLQMLPIVMNNYQGGNMMQQQQMQPQQMPQQQMQQQQMQQMPQAQMQGNNGKFHITLAIQKPFLQGGGNGGNGGGGGGNGGNGGGGNGGNGGGGGMQMDGNMMQMMQMLMMMMQNQQQGGMNQQNMMSQNMMNQNMMGQNMMNQNMMNQNMMNQNMGKQKMYQNMMNQNMMNQNMMGQGMGQQNMMGQGMGQQNMMGQGMGQQNMMQQNMMNQNMMQQGGNGGGGGGGGNGGNGGGGGGGGNGGNQQCVTCNRPKKEVTITYNLDLKRLPIKFRLFG